MTTKDKTQFLALAESLGYEVPQWSEGGGPMGPGMMPSLAPDGSVVVTETITMTLTRKTTYPAK
jgi:hypothetical protein